MPPRLQGLRKCLIISSELSFLKPTRHLQYYTEGSLHGGNAEYLTRTFPFDISNSSKIILTFTIKGLGYNGLFFKELRITFIKNN